MIGWLWASQGEMTVGKINIAVVKTDVNLWRGEVMLLYQALWRAHAECTTLFRYSAQKMNSQ